MKKSRIPSEFWIPFVYIMFGALWILTTDRLLASLTEDADLTGFIQTYKGWSFVAISALVIFLLLHRESDLRDSTETKRRESEDRYRRIVETAQEGIWSIDTESRTTFVNQKMADMLGYRVEEMTGSPLFSFMDEEGRAVASDNLERRRRGITEQHDFKFCRKDGTNLWAILETNPILDSNGQYLGALAMVTDISERKQAEQMLQNERDFSDRALNSLPGVFYMYDEDRRFLRWNRNFETVTGYSGVEIARMNPLDFFAGEEKNLPAGRIQEVFATGASAVEAGFISKDGAHMPYYFTGRTIDVDGRKCLIGVGIDISARKHMEQAVQRNEQVLRLFIENAPAAIAMFDRDMKYMFASKRYLADYELAEQDLVGRSHYEVFPEIPERWREIHARCLAGATEKADEDPFPRQSGKLDWIRWEILPWYETSGDIGGIILLSEVITDRKRTEQEVRLSRDRLAELSRRLVETQETERRSIGREMHDQFGQMLTALKINLDMLRQLPPESAGNRLAQAQELTNDLLNRTSRLSLELRPPMLDDLGLLPALVWHINRYQEETSISIELEHADVEGRRFNAEIEATAYRLIQEALTNVARHARATRVRIDVRIRGEWLDIHLEDDGVGFDAKSALAQNRGLTGMKERALLVGSTFEIESEPGKGTKKFIRLPLQEKAI